MNTAENKIIIQRYYDEVFNHQQSDAIERWVAADIKVHDPLAGELQGIEGFRQLASIFLLGFPQQHTTFEIMVAEGDLVAVLHTHTATHTGNFMGLPPTGKTVKVVGLELFRIGNSKIVELWRHDDDAGLMMQLGMIPAPAEAAHG